MPRNRASAAATGLPVAHLLALHDCLLVALSASETRFDYSQARRECRRSYTRAALRHTRRLLGDQI